MPVWLSYPPRSDGDDAGAAGAATAETKHCLIYFIPGNPGFIDYYEPFLSTLRARLDEVEDAHRADGSHVRFHILGRNLIGFEDGDDGGGAYGAGPFDLDTQIRASMDAVSAARIDLGQGGGPRHGGVFDEVVLVGHSVGSYIALDVFRRQQQAEAGAAEKSREEAHSHASADASADAPVPVRPAPLRLRLGILLFATLTHLAQSQRGRQLERLMELPLLGPYTHVVAQAALWCLPFWLKDWIVRSVLRFPPHAADVTVRFLASRGGARQALFLGRDELVRIGEDQWEDELWGTTHSGKGGKAPKFIILFGENDHWVANDFRDRFIARRDAHELGRASIVMDERGWPHDFCIRHGEEVAETVTTWIADVAEEF